MGNECVLVGTPCYNGWLHSDWDDSIDEFRREGIRFAKIKLGDESLILRARNIIHSFFYHRKDLTVLLWLDADVFLPGKALRAMLETKKDAIGAKVYLKGPNQAHNVGGIIDQSEYPLVRVKKIGTGALLLSRKACERLYEAAKPYRAPVIRANVPQFEQRDIYRVGIKDGEYLSEDYWICAKLTEMGIPVYWDARAKTRHNGMAVFEGPDAETRGRVDTER